MRNTLLLGIIILILFYLIIPSNKTKITKVNDIKVRIDLDNSYQFATFIGGSKPGQPDKLIVDGINMIDRTNLNSFAATFSAASADFNKDGFSDLIINRSDGITLYLNHGRGKFEKVIISRQPGDPISNIAITDYNKDGHLDFYITSYTNKNRLFEGLGIGAFEDVTRLTRTGGPKGTIDAKWLDIDGDTLPDLVVGVEGGGREIYRNSRGASGDKFISGPMFYNDGKKYSSMSKKSRKLRMDGKNWVGIKLPDHLINSTVRVVGRNSETGEVRTEIKQYVKEDDQVLRIEFGNIDRVIHMEVNSIYNGGRWIHPNPKMNKIATFRDFQSHK